MVNFKGGLFVANIIIKVFIIRKKRADDLFLLPYC